MILPIYLPVGAEPPPGAIDLDVSTDPERHRASVSVVLRCLDVASIAAAALLVLRRVGFTEAGAGWRARRNYEAAFGDDGAPRGELAERLRCSVDAASVMDVCKPSDARRIIALEDCIFVVACWLLWGDPRGFSPWGVDAMARELAYECGVDVLPWHALASARDVLERAAAAPA